MFPCWVYGYGCGCGGLQSSDRASYFWKSVNGQTMKVWFLSSLYLWKARHEHYVMQFVKNKPMIKQNNFGYLVDYLITILQFMLALTRSCVAPLLAHRSRPCTRQTRILSSFPSPGRWETPTNSSPQMGQTFFGGLPSIYRVVPVQQPEYCPRQSQTRDRPLRLDAPDTDPKVQQSVYINLYWACISL